MGRASCGCTISMRSILTLSKMWDADAKFAKRVSSNTRKGKMQMQLYMIGRLKSICKFKEKQVADTLVPKRASATVNIKVLQIHQLSKKYLHKRITQDADTSAAKEHLRKQITESPPLLIVPPISITVHLQERKDYAIQRIGVGLARRS